MPVKSRQQLKEAFELRDTPTEKDFEDLFDSFSHKSEDLISGGANIEVATQQEAEAGTANDKMMTPLRVKQSIFSWVRLNKLSGLLSDINALINPIISSLNSHKSASNPHNITAQTVGLDKLPNDKSDDTDLNSSNTLATSAAVFSLYERINGFENQIGAYFAPTLNITANISKGWQTPEKVIYVFFRYLNLIEFSWGIYSSTLEPSELDFQDFTSNNPFPRLTVFKDFSTGESESIGIRFTYKFFDINGSITTRHVDRLHTFTGA